MNKEMLIDAICGRGFPTMDLAVEMTDRGLAKFTGNQWNEDWQWRREALLNLNETELTELYTRVRYAKGKGSNE